MRGRNKSSGRKGIVSSDERYDNTKFWIEYGIDLERRIVMLDEDVDEYSTGWIVRAINKMVANAPDKPIDIIVNSYGGYCYDGWSLYDEIVKNDQCEIRTHAKGKIMSMGLVIFMAGDKRLSDPNATFMAHSVSSLNAGKAYEIVTDAEETKRLQEKQIQMFAERTNKDAKWWRNWIKYEDRYITPEKARELEIVTEDPEEGY